MCWNGGQIFTSGLFFLKKRSSSKQKNNRNISLGVQPVHTMPPFLPRAEGVWGLAPRRVCAAQSLPDILTHLCSGAQSPLPAKPNTNASFTTASATCDFSCHCFAKPPSRAKGRLLWPGLPTTVWRQETTMHSQSSSPRSMKLNSSAA